VKKARTIGLPRADEDRLEDLHIRRDARIVGEDEAEVRRKNSNNRGSVATVADRAADDGGIGTKAASPHTMGEDDGAGGVLEVVFGAEEAPQRGACAEERQEIAGDLGNFHLLGGAVAGKRAIGHPNAGNLIELRGALAKMKDLEGRERSAARV